MEKTKLDEVTAVLPARLKTLINGLPEKIKSEIYEIRLRKNKPLIIFGKFGNIIIRTDSTFSSVTSVGAAIVEKNEFDETLKAVCGYSLYSHQNEIANGFITFASGNRAGFCGEAVVDSGVITTLKNITSINIRVGCNNSQCPKELLDISNKFTGLIVAGEPCSGKTTVLKGFAESLSSTFSGGFKKTVIIDERFEMKNTNGINCDILSGYPKSVGIVHAIRNLSPEIIICDEITTEEEAEIIAKGFYSGVKFVVSIHCSSIADILNKNVSRILLNSRFFDYIAILSGEGKIKQLVKTEEIINELVHCGIDNYGNIQHCVFHNSKRKQAP